MWSAAVTWTVVLAVVIQGAPQANPTAVLAATALYERRQYVEARDLIAPLVSAKDRAATLLFSRVLLALGDHDTAIATLRRLTAAGGSADEHVWLARAHATRAQAVNAFSALRAAGSARGEWLRALELDPRNLDARSDLIRFYLNAPGVAGGSDREAQRHIAALMDLDAYRGGIEAGRMARQGRRVADAEREFRRAVARSPGGPEANTELVGLLAERREWTAAFDAVSAWRLAAPGGLEAQYQMGRLAALSGQHLDEGWAALTTYLGHPEDRQRPTYASAHVRRAEIARRRGDLTAATSEVDAALRLDAKNAAALTLRRELAR